MPRSKVPFWSKRVRGSFPWLTITSLCWSWASIGQCVSLHSEVDASCLADGRQEERFAEIQAPSSQKPQCGHHAAPSHAGQGHPTVAFHMICLPQVRCCGSPHEDRSRSCRPDSARVTGTSTSVASNGHRRDHGSH